MHRPIPTCYALLLAGLCASALACGIAPCPEGTTRDGNVCRRHRAQPDAGADLFGDDKPTTGMQSGSVMNETAASGSSGSRKGGAAGAAVSGNTAPTKSIAGSPADRPAANGGSTGSTTPANNNSATGASAGSGAPNTTNNQATAGSNTASAGSQSTAHAGNPGSATSGSSGNAQAGSTAQPTAGSVSQPTAGMTGPAPSGEDWSCFQVGDVCSCIETDGTRQNLCGTQRGSCCYMGEEGGTAVCACAPEGSASCRDGLGPTAVRVSACPSGT